MSFWSPTDMDMVDFFLKYFQTDDLVLYCSHDKNAIPFGD